MKSNRNLTIIFSVLFQVRATYVYVLVDSCFLTMNSIESHNRCNWYGKVAIYLQYFRLLKRLDKLIIHRILLLNLNRITICLPFDYQSTAITI